MKRKLFSVMSFFCLAVLCMIGINANEIKAATNTYDTVLYAMPEYGVSENSFYILVPGVTKRTSITEVTSSDTKIARITYSKVIKTTNASKVISYSTEVKSSDSKKTTYSGYIGFQSQKAGAVTISYKMNGVTQSKKILIKKYTNPVSSISISGIDKGKNIASSFKKYAIIDKTQSKDVTNGKVKIKTNASKGWLVQNIYVTDYDTNSEVSWSNTKGLASVTYCFGDLIADDTSRICICYYNSKTKGYAWQYIYVNWDED